MEVGQWEVAAEQLDALAAAAPDATAAARAVDDAILCRQWIARGLVLVPRKDLGESTVHARQAGQRTTDELAVLYTNAIFYGLGTGGWLAVQTKPNSAGGAIMPALGLAGASVLGVYALDSGTPLRYGAAQSMVTGLYLGLYEGIAWTVWSQSRYRYSDAWSAETVATVLWGSATLGVVAGGVLGARAKTTPGRASFVLSAGLWSGFVAGLLTSASTPDDDRKDDRTWLAVALGLNAGAVAGALTAGDVSPTVSRVRFLDLGGIAGLVLSGGLYLAAGADSSKAAAAVTGVGTAAGLGIAWLGTAGMPKDEPSSDAPSVASTLRLSAAPVRGGATLGFAGEF